MWVVASAIESNPRMLCGPLLAGLVADVCRSARRPHVGLDCASTPELRKAHQQIVTAESLQEMDLREACALAAEIRAGGCAETDIRHRLGGGVAQDSLTIPAPGEDERAAALSDMAECDATHIHCALADARQVRKIEEILRVVMVATAEGRGAACAALGQGLLDDVCEHPPRQHRGLDCPGTPEVMRYHRELMITVAFVSLGLADVCEVGRRLRETCDSEIPR